MQSLIALVFIKHPSAAKKEGMTNCYVRAAITAKIDVSALARLAHAFQEPLAKLQ